MRWGEIIRRRVSTAHAGRRRRLIVFVLLRVVTGDTRMMIPTGASPRHRPAAGVLGLDQPIMQQSSNWFGQALRAISEFNKRAQECVQLVLGDCRYARIGALAKGSRWGGERIAR